MPNNQPEKVLSFENHPIHVLKFNGKSVFLANEIGRVLGVKEPLKSLKQSKAIEEGVDFALIPSKMLDVADRYSVTSAPIVTILYESGLFLFIIRSNMPIAVPFTRWVIREAIPLALQASQPQDKIEYSSREVLSLMALEVKGSEFARAELKRLGLTPNQEQLTLSQGGANV